MRTLGGEDTDTGPWARSRRLRPEEARWSLLTNHEHGQRRDSRGPTEPQQLTQESGVGAGGCQTAKRSGSGTRAKSLSEATVSGASLGKRPEQGGLCSECAGGEAGEGGGRVDLCPCAWQVAVPG